MRSLLFLLAFHCHAVKHPWPIPEATKLEVKVKKRFEPIKPGRCGDHPETDVKSTSCGYTGFGAASLAGVTNFDDCAMRCFACPEDCGYASFSDIVDECTLYRTCNSSILVEGLGHRTAVMEGTDVCVWNVSGTMDPFNICNFTNTTTDSYEEEEEEEELEPELDPDCPFKELEVVVSKARAWEDEEGNPHLILPVLADPWNPEMRIAVTWTTGVTVGTVQGAMLLRNEKKRTELLLDKKKPRGKYIQITAVGSITDGDPTVDCSHSQSPPAAPPHHADCKLSPTYEVEKSWDTGAMVRVTLEHWVDNKPFRLTYYEKGLDVKPRSLANAELQGMDEDDNGNTVVNLQLVPVAYLHGGPFQFTYQIEPAPSWMAPRIECHRPWPPPSPMIPPSPSPSPPAPSPPPPSAPPPLFTSLKDSTIAIVERTCPLKGHMAVTGHFREGIGHIGEDLLKVHVSIDTPVGKKKHYEFITVFQHGWTAPFQVSGLVRHPTLTPPHPAFKPTC